MRSRVLLQNVACCLVRQPDLDLLGDQIQVDLLDQQVDDLEQIFIGQRGEQNDLVEAVEEFGVERPLHLAITMSSTLAGIASLRGAAKPMPCAFPGTARRGSTS